MEEDQYRSTYRSINPLKCPYEKALNSRLCHCAQMERFCLADREGVACKSARHQQRCIQFLDQLRPQARFALQLSHIDGPLPHAREIKVQIGGILGLMQSLHDSASLTPPVEDINAVLTEAEQHYGSFSQFPYTEIVKAIVRFEVRKKRSRKDDR